MPRVLVVGATGALRPAALLLAARGEHVLALARDRARLDDLAAEAAGEVTPVAVDHGDPAALGAALDAALGAALDAALLYCPTAPPASRALLAARTGGPVVDLLTSAAADPGRTGPEVDVAALPSVGTVRVLLGWTDGPRWHTPEEISRAAVAALGDGRDRLLGRVRPWSERPS